MEKKEKKTPFGRQIYATFRTMFSNLFCIAELFNIYFRIWHHMSHEKLYLLFANKLNWRNPSTFTATQ
jgi:hypothetical protein